MAFILSPNMDLPVPVVGGEPGPNYAQDVNNSLTLIDAHDHSPGKGVQITPAGLNINTVLSFQSNFATNLAGLNLIPQSSTPGINTIYESGVNLFFVDGNGNNIQITANGGIAGTSGSISNLTPPASAAYVAGLSTFVWESNTNIAANMDFGSATLRNLSPNSTFGLTLSPPAGLSSNYTITLPPLPPQQNFMTIDNAGNIAAPIAFSQGITTSNIAPATILGSNIAALTVTGGPSGNIALNTITLDNLATSILEWNTTPVTSSGSFTVPANVNKLFIVGVGGGGGGGGCNTSVAAPGGGGGGSTPMSYWIPVSPSDVLTIVIGTGGVGSPAGVSGSGGTGGDTTLTYATGELLFKGATGGSIYTGGSTAAAGQTFYAPVYSVSAQSGGLGEVGAGANGQNAIPTMVVAVGATGGSGAGSNGGGGAGGSGIGPGSNGGAGVGSGVPPAPSNATNPGSGGGGSGATGSFAGGGSGANGAPGAVYISWLGHP